MKSNDSGLMTSMGRAQCGERGKVNECWAFGRQAAKTFHKRQTYGSTWRRAGALSGRHPDRRHSASGTASARSVPRKVSGAVRASPWNQGEHEVSL